MIDAKSLKQQLNTSQVISLVESLGGELREQRDSYLIFTSICHYEPNIAALHKPHLYYYVTTQSFYCYRCCLSMDIFSLIEQVWDLQDREYTFTDEINYVVSTLGLAPNQINRPKHVYDDWRSSLGRFLNNTTNPTKSYPTYDKSILDFFEPIYRQEWIDDGITIDTMEKYRIGWYQRNQQVSIPVFGEKGELLGIHARNFDPERAEWRKYEPLRTISTEYAFSTNETIYGLNFNRENIKYTRQALIFESEKSVLQCETILEHNNTVAMFGMNLSNHNRNQLLKYDIDEIVICIDKWSDVENGRELWNKAIAKIIKKLKGFVKISYIEDVDGLLDFKDSPTDKGKDVWEKLYGTRIYI